MLNEAKLRSFWLKIVYNEILFEIAWFRVVICFHVLVSMNTNIEFETSNQKKNEDDDDNNNNISTAYTQMPVFLNKTHET